MRRIIRAIKLFILQQRIDMLRADMYMAEERRQHALMMSSSLDAWSTDAHRRLRSLRAQQSLLERPERLLAQALSKAMRHD